jgi:hypothetical protein
MEQVEKLSLNVNGPELRIGDLPAPILRKKHEISGQITSPADYLISQLKNRKQFSIENFLCKVNVKESKILLTDNHLDTDGEVTVTGTMNLDGELTQLGINAKKTYSSIQLSEILRFNRSLFANKDECNTIVSKLKKHVAEIKGQIENTSNNQGHKKESFEVEITSNVDLSFTLESYVFGHDVVKKKFKVDVFFDLRDKQIDYWLDSVELKEIISDENRAIIDKEVTRILETGITLVYV